MLISEDGSKQLLGVVLPADFCAEHEWGIDRLRLQFGIPLQREYGVHKPLSVTEGPFGLPRRTATKLPDSKYLLYDERGETACLCLGFALWYSTDEDRSRTLLDKLPQDLKYGKYDLQKGNFIKGAWDETSLGILVHGKELVAQLRDLYERIKAIDVAIFIGGARLPVFENPGLVVAIPSRVPAKLNEQLQKGDEDRAALYRASDATGIVAKVDAKMKNRWGGSAYCALSPMWAHGEKRFQTKHPVMYWLNPVEQDKYNYGGFTVEELEQWIEGKGPVPMTPEQQRRYRERG